MHSKSHINVISQFCWRKGSAQGFYWSNEAQPIKNDWPPIEGPFLLEKIGPVLQLYQPLYEEPTLFLKFAALKNEPESILNFANNYGRLIQHGVSLKSPDIRSGGIPVWGESYKMWEDEIEHMFIAVNLWEGMQNQDISILQRYIEWNNLGEVTYSGFNSLTKGMVVPDPSPEVMQCFVTGDLINPGLYLLHLLINAKLHENHVDPFLNWDNNKLVAQIRPATLLAAMWYQLFEAAAGLRKFKRCDICMEWEDVTSKNKNWTKHPECSVRERSARYRMSKN